MYREPITSPDAITYAVLRWPVLLCSCSFLILSFLLPIYAQRLGASALDIGGLFAVVGVVMLLVRPLVGEGLDRFGRKHFFVAGLLCYAGSMALFAIAGNMPLLYLARLFQGLGRVFTWIAAYTIAMELATPAKRGEAVGDVDGASDRGGLYGAIIALALLGLVPLLPGWHVLFLLYTILAGFGAWLAWHRVPETRPERAAHDQRELAPERPAGRMQRLGALLMPQATLALFSGPFVWLLAVVFVTKASAALVSPLLLVFLQDTFTTNIWGLVVVFLPQAVVLGFLPARMGRFSDNLNRVLLIVLGLVSSGLASFLLPRIPHLGWVTMCCTINAIGIVMASPAQKALVGDLTPKETWGRAYGLFTFAGGLGTALGPLLGGVLYQTAGRTAPFYVNGLLLLASAVWVALVLGSRKRGGMTATVRTSRMSEQDGS